MITSSLFVNGVVFEPLTYEEMTLKNPASSLIEEIVKSANAEESAFFDTLK
jgi:hypothetical protein